VRLWAASLAPDVLGIRCVPLLTRALSDQSAEPGSVLLRVNPRQCGAQRVRRGRRARQPHQAGGRSGKGARMYRQSACGTSSAPRARSPLGSSSIRGAGFRGGRHSCDGLARGCDLRVRYQR
jgi:hypothetical protein